MTKPSPDHRHNADERARELTGRYRVGVTRTLVSFEAPEGSFPTDRDEGDAPPGLGIAGLVSDALRRNGVDHQAPQELGGWAWAVCASNDYASIESIVGLVGDTPVQWLIVTEIRPRRRLRRRARQEIEAATASMLDSWIRALAEVPTGQHGITNVRWYYKEDFDRDYGVTWSSDPFV